jgi:hypothetical protein
MKDIKNTIDEKGTKDEKLLKIFNKMTYDGINGS